MNASWPYAADRPAGMQSSDSVIFQDDESASDEPTVSFGKDDEAGVVITPPAPAATTTNSPKRQHGRRSAPSPLALHERSHSQNNRMSGIRVVPYSPSRLVADSETPSSAASTSSSPRLRLFLAKDDGDENDDSDSTRTRWTKRASRSSWGSMLAATAAAAVSLVARSPSRKSSIRSSIRTVSGKMGKKTGTAGSDKGDKEEGTAARDSRSALSTPVSADFSLASNDHRDVSGPKLPTGQSPTGNDNWTICAGTPASTAHAATLLQSPVDASGHLLAYQGRQLEQDGCRLDGPALLALSHEFDESAAPSTVCSASPSSSYPASPALSALPLPPSISGSAFSPLSPSASVTSLVSASSSQVGSRPNSRRHNRITVHSDKTFSLVSPPSATSVATSSNVSLLADPISFLRTPPLTFSTTTLRSSVSRDRLSSALFSIEDLTNSPLSTSATALDRSSLTPFAASPSPASSAIHLTGGGSEDTDAAGPSATSSWNYRRSGSLRQVPRTPELKPKGKGKGKGKGRAVSPASRSRQRPAYHSYHPQLQYAPSTFDSVNFLPPLAESSPSAVTVTSVGATSTVDVAAAAAAAASSSAARLPKREASFGSDQSAGALSIATSIATSLPFSASIASARTNYKVYAHSPSPVHHDSSDSLGFTSSTVSFSEVGNTTNIEIHDRSSPVDPAPPLLPLLRRTVDPDQTFTSLASFDESIDEGPNIVILGASSPPASPPFRRDREDRSSVGDPSSSPPFPPCTADTEDSEPNYVLYNRPSAVSVLPPHQPPSTTSSSSAASSQPPVSRQPWPAFSQESLVVRPLQPARKRSSERFGSFKSRSRESLRHAASIKSISSVILNQESASVFFAGQAFLNLSIRPVPVFTASKRALPVSITTTVPRRKPVPRLPPPMEDRVRERTHTPSMWSPSSSSAPPLPDQAQRSARLNAMVEEHAHQWSSQLSTVMSESEADSSRSPTAYRTRSQSASGYGARTASAISGTSGRRSSVGWAASSSAHSRNMPSISSSLALQLDETASRRSRSSSLLPERSQAAYSTTRSSTSASPGPMRMAVVRDQDEHGDGLADLHDVTLRQPQSRSVLSGFFSSTNSSSRNLHSSGSTRSIASPIPAWARVYYGSGERKHLAASVSEGSIGGGDWSRRGSASSSRPASMFRRSPSADPRAPSHIYNARRRPREVGPGGPAGEQPRSDAASMEMGETDEAGAGGVLEPGQYLPRGLRKVTSSLWSPHLRLDRRAARFTVWDPPSVSWSAETGPRLNRRSTQIFAFTVGFIFPFGRFFLVSVCVCLNKRSLE